MSTTSTTFDKRKRNKRKPDNLKAKGVDSMKLYSKDTGTFAHRQSDELSKKWSNDRVIDELSSFIAEYSYTENSDTQISKPDTPKSCTSLTCKDSYSVYRANTSESNGGIFRRKKKKDTYKHNSVVRKKSVEWEDSQVPPKNKNKKNKSKKSKKRSDSSVPKRSSHKKNDYRQFDSTGETSERECSGTRRSRSIKKVKGPKQITIRKSRTKTKASRCQERPSRSETECPVEIEKSRSPRIRVRRVSRPREIKHMPVKYKGKKTLWETCYPSERKPTFDIKISKERRIEYRNRFIQVKNPVLSDSPTIVTLFPKNSKRDEEVDILKNPGLLCKCYECMKKYESLVKLSEYHNGVFSQSNSAKDPILRSPKTVTHQPNQMKGKPNSLPAKKVRIKDTSNSYRGLDEPMACQQFSGGRQESLETCETDWPPCAKGPLFFSFCNNPCYESKFVSEWNFDSCEETDEGKCYKSIYFKLNCLYHPMDSAVTKFFHSVLRKSMCT